MKRLEWSRDNDKVLGPFLYCKSGFGDGFSLIATSGREEGNNGATIRLSVGKHTFMVAIPQILIPLERRKVKAVYWDEATIAKMGRDWYYNYTPREFGVRFHKDRLNFFFGRQDMSSKESKSWGFYIPFLQWRFHAHRHFDFNHRLLRTFFEADRRRVPSGKLRLDHWHKEHEYAERLSRRVYTFLDYDGEEIEARCRIEEREWRFGEGWFMWLHLFRKPIIRRSLDIRFTKETGRRKGSWKGGTIGHGIDMKPGESIDDAFKRYCAEHDMTFVRRESDWIWSPAVEASERPIPEDATAGVDYVVISDGKVK